MNVCVKIGLSLPLCTLALRKWSYPNSTLIGEHNSTLIGEHNSNLTYIVHLHTPQDHSRPSQYVSVLKSW